MTTVRPFLHKRGDVVTVPFPFSSFVAGGSFKRRPAVVLAAWYLGNPVAPMAIDYMVAMITTQNTPDPYLEPILK